MRWAGLPKSRSESPAVMLCCVCVVWCGVCVCVCVCVCMRAHAWVRKCRCAEVVWVLSTVMRHSHPCAHGVHRTLAHFCPWHAPHTRLLLPVARTAHSLTSARGTHRTLAHFCPWHAPHTRTFSGNSACLYQTQLQRLETQHGRCVFKLVLHLA
jgi:hypothetical protein